MPIAPWDKFGIKTSGVGKKTCGVLTTHLCFGKKGIGGKNIRFASSTARSLVFLIPQLFFIGLANFLLDEL